MFISRHFQLVIVPKQPYLLHAEFSAEPAGNRGANLIASIRFGDGEFNLVVGTIRFRVSEIYVTAICDKCILPSNNWLFRDSTTISTTSQFSIQRGNTSSEENASNSGISIGKDNQLSLSAAQKLALNNSIGTTETFSETTTYINAQGSEKSPRWLIYKAPHQQYLHGTLCDKSVFAKIEPEGEIKHSLKLTFKIPRNGISFSLGNQISAENPNKSGLIKHIIRLLYTERDYDIPEILLGGMQ